jgi:hypothetical protein
MKQTNKIFTGYKTGYVRGGERTIIKCEIKLVTGDNHTRNYDTLETVTDPYYTVSFTGEVGKDEYGQINLYHTPSEMSENLKEIFSIWDNYHLNDLQDGTKTQQAYLKQFRSTLGYDKSCQLLQNAGIYEDRGYRFGSGWLLKVLTVQEINYIKSLFPENRIQVTE